MQAKILYNEAANYEKELTNMDAGVDLMADVLKGKRGVLSFVFAS
jgi:hypothetical protein